LIYLDTSALGAIYFPERASHAVERLILAEHLCAISELTAVEMYSGISRRLRTRELSRQEADVISDSFRADLSGETFKSVQVGSAHYRYARGLIARFDTPLRALDALHLAITADEGFELATLDAALAESARRLGVRLRQI